MSPSANGDNPPVISDIDLEIREHEFVVLVGPSGCGKSTLLRMVAGLEEITSGTISIGGRVVNEVPPKEPQHRHGVPELRALPAHDRTENLQFGLKIRRYAAGEIDRLVNEAARILGLEQLMDRRPRTCPAGSGSGWRSAAPSSASPRWFLFDEPLSNLDAKLRVQMPRGDSRSCSTASRSPPSTSRTIRSRR